MAPKLPHLDKCETKTVPPEERTPNPEVCSTNTVQPLEVFRPPTDLSENKFTLQSVLAPADSADSANEISDPSPNHAPKLDEQGKATRQNSVSATDPALTEVIRTALSGAGIADLANDRASHRDQKRNSLPNGKTTPGNSWQHVPNEENSSRGKAASHINLLDTPQPDKEIDESQVQKVLKTLADAGYTVRRDPSYSPKVQNTGSVAGNKSDKQLVCETCRKFKGRRCELK